MTNDEHVLDIGSLSPDRRHVRFTEDGPLEPMALPAELSIQQRADVLAYHRLGEKLNENAASADEARRLSRALDKAARIVLPEMAEEAFEALPDLHKEAVVLDFMSAFGDSMKRLAIASAGPEATEAAMDAMQTRAQISGS